MTPIQITLGLPPSANRYWRIGKGRIYRSDEAEEYKSDVYYRCLRARIKPIDGMLAVTMRVYRARRSGDLDNRIKIVLDALNGIAYHDDKQIVEIHAYRFDDKRDPRVGIEINKLFGTDGCFAAMRAALIKEIAE